MFIRSWGLAHLIFIVTVCCVVYSSRRVWALKLRRIEVLGRLLAAAAVAAAVPSVAFLVRDSSKFFRKSRTHWNREKTHFHAQNHTVGRERERLIGTILTWCAGTSKESQPTKPNERNYKDQGGDEPNYCFRNCKIVIHWTIRLFRPYI